MSLSDVVMSANDYISYRWLDVEDVKEAVAQLKEELRELVDTDVYEIINKIFGDLK